MIQLFLFLVLSSGIPVQNLDQLETRLKQGKDTVFVLNFWATWCKPCVAELPNFDRISREYRNKAVKVILVNLDDLNEVKSKVEPFVIKRGLDPEVICLNESKPHLWIDRVDSSWSGAIPATLIVQQSTKRRQFFEQEFSYEELNTTLAAFIKTSP